MTRLLRLRAVAAETGLPIGTLYSLATPHGDLPVTRIGGRIWIDPADLEAWLARHRTGERRVAPEERETPVDREHRRRSAIHDLPGADRYTA